MEDYFRLSRQGGPAVVVMGGGTGLSVLLRGMKKMTDNLSAIVTVADDGGGSGILREDLGMLPPGDVRSCILAMADEEGIMQDLLQYRFSEGRLAGQSFGNLLLAAMNGILGSFEAAVEKTSDILKIKGRVLPVTGSDICLGALLENGNRILGESMIAEKALESKSAIEEVFLFPEKPAACSGVLEAIEDADVIVIGPGSLYTSLVPNLLVDGVGEAIKRSPGKKIYICNVMTQPGETDGYTAADHVRTVNKYLGEGVLEVVIANDKVIDEEVLFPYLRDGAKQIMPEKADRETMEEMGITLITSNFTSVEKGYIRHDAERIANVIAGLLFECN